VQESSFILNKGIEVRVSI